MVLTSVDHQDREIPMDQVMAVVVGEPRGVPNNNLEGVQVPVGPPAVGTRSKPKVKLSRRRVVDELVVPVASPKEQFRIVKISLMKIRQSFRRR